MDSLPRSVLGLPLLLATACATGPQPISASDWNGPGDPALVRTGDLHDFDAFAGDWHLENRRLKQRGVGSTEWETFPADSRTTVHLGSMANVDELVFPTKGWSGLTVRTFDRARRQWSIYWVNSRDGVLTPPVVGGFSGDRGEFYGWDQDGGRRVLVRFVWTRAGGVPRRWEQSFSYDGGKTWELNWVNELTRAKSAER